MSDVDDDTLGDLFPEPDRPPPPEPTYESYTRQSPESSSQNDWKEIKIRLVGSHPLWGHHLWNAARSFATFLDQNSETFCKGKNILELGAGGALPSLVAVLDGAKTTVITDYADDDLVQNMEANVEKNVPSHLRGSVHVKGYTWGKSVQPLLEVLPPSEKFDIILMSDLVFNHSEHGALLKTCDAALASLPSSSPRCTPCLLVFYTHHRPHLANRDLDFFRLAREQGWDCKEIVTDRMQAMFPEDSGDEDVRATVHGWKVWRATTSS